MQLQVKLRESFFLIRSEEAEGFRFWHGSKPEAIFLVLPMAVLQFLLRKWQGSSDETILIAGRAVGIETHPRHPSWVPGSRLPHPLSAPCSCRCGTTGTGPPCNTHCLAMRWNGSQGTWTRMHKTRKEGLVMVAFLCRTPFRILIGRLSVLI